MDANRRRALAAVALSAAVLAAAACGAGGPGGSVPEAASFLPADVPAFVSIDGDARSEQWQTARGLIERFPAGAQALEELPDEDLGGEVGIAVLDLDAAADEPPVVLVARPDDPSAFLRELEEGDDPPATRELEGGWYLVADDEARLEQVVAGAETAALAGDEDFRRAFESIPDDALARLYLDGTAVAEAAGEQLAGAPLGSGPAGGAGVEWLAVAVQAESDGFRVEGLVRTDAEGPAGTTFVPELASLVPADALLYAGFADTGTFLAQALAGVSGDDERRRALEQAELLLGVDLERDLLPLLAGEQALFLRAGAPVPEVTLILSPAEPARALATLHKLATGLPRLAEAAGDEAPFTLSETTAAGVDVKTLDFAAEDVSLSYGLVGDHLVLSTQAKGIADVAVGGERLADDPLYEEALEAAGLEGETVGLGFVDLDAAVELLEALAPASDGDTGIDASGLEPLRTLLVTVAGDGDELRLVGFLGIE